MLIQTLDGLSKSQAARELGVSAARVDQMLNNGDLPYLQTTLGRLIDRKAVSELKAKRQSDRLKRGINCETEAA